MLDSTTSDLPGDPEALLALLIESRSENAKLRATVVHHQALIDKLKLQLARLRRMQFGRSSEKLAAEIEQLELLIEELETPTPAQVKADSASPLQAADADPVKAPRALPEHLPREAIVHEVSCTCTTCGGALRAIGEDVSEMLEFVPEQWKVIRHVRPKYACGTCHTLAQAPAPIRPIARGMAGPGLLAHVLVAKYADHLPLYRQSEIYALGRGDRALDPGRLGRRQCRTAGATGRCPREPRARRREAACRRHPGAGAVSGPWQDQDRATVDLRAG